jgi:lipoyl(octanoyl) transferase
VRRIARDVLVYVYRWHDAAPQLLMLRRAPDRGGFWHWVSGAPERGESDLEAAIRETREETGLDVSRSIVALGYRYSYRLNPERAARWLKLYGPGVEQIPVDTFAAKAPPGWEPELDLEHDEYAWCSFAEAERRLFWPGAPEGLAHLRATLDVLRGHLLEHASQGLACRRRLRMARAPRAPSIQTIAAHLEA